MDESRAPGRRPGGRPRKERAERRDSYVGFWVTAEEHAAIRQRAEVSGMLAVSAFARAVALGVPVRPPARASHSPELIAQLRRIGNNLNQWVMLAHAGALSPQDAESARAAMQEISVVLRAQFHAPEYR